MSLELCLEGRQSLSMSQIEREIVPDNEKKKERKKNVFCPWLELSCISLECKICDYQQRSGECMMGYTVQGN